MEKEIVKCFVLNKAFIGGWLENEDNIPHEIINFFRADNGDIFLYNTPYGCKVVGDKDKEYQVPYVFLASKTSRGYLIQYCIEIDGARPLHDYSRGKKQSKGKEINNITCNIKNGINEIAHRLNPDYDSDKKYEQTGIKYGNVPIEDLFNDSLLVFPVTYKVKRIYKYNPMCNNPIFIPLKTCPENMTKEEKSYIFQRNYSFIPEKTNDKSRKRAYLKAFNLLNDNLSIITKKWENYTNKIKTLSQSEKDEEAMKAVSLNKFIDLIDNYKSEECYTKILSKLFANNKGEFLEYFINSLYKDKNIKINLRSDPLINTNIKEGLDVTNELVRKINLLDEIKLDEYKADDYGRIDIYAENKNCSIIIENKIDSNFVDDSQNKNKKQHKGPQLARYQTWANTVKRGKKHFYIVLVPEYRKDEIIAEQNNIYDEFKQNNGKIRDLEFKEKYKICSYKQVYKIFYEFRKNKGFKGLNYSTYLLDDVESLLKRLSLDLREYYTAKFLKKLNKRP
ncbi:MAG: PD-(D/E)XK nuclease family protein [Bacilli bacterium]|nr:PD-(D/E)XK nuclease family protein [Bacilli bacterium]